MIYKSPITKDALVNTVDTCRIFKASFDFWDEEGAGWKILRWLPDLFSEFSTADTEATLTFLSWLIEASSADIKANYYLSNIGDVVIKADDSLADAVSLLLEMGPPLQDYEKFFLGDRPLLLFYHIRYHKWNIINAFLALGADPYQVCLAGWYSPVAESPLSLAMYSSWTFWHFRNALRGKGLVIQDIVREELKEGRPLLDAGWQMETLSALLEHEFEPEIVPKHWRDHIHCDNCKGSYDVPVEPYWQGILESIKHRTYPLDTCSDSEDKQPTNRQQHLTVLNDGLITNTTNDHEVVHDHAFTESEAAEPDEESLNSEDDISNTMYDRGKFWCIDCWYHFKKTGRPRRPWRPRPPSISETALLDRDDASEDKFSPYLFNT